MCNVVFHSAIEPNGSFFVRALHSLPEHEILAGDYLTIDPEKQPRDGSLILVDDEVLACHGQVKADGVVVYIGRAR